MVCDKNRVVKSMMNRQEPLLFVTFIIGSAFRVYVEKSE
jgi:hypothetical protein